MARTISYYIASFIMSILLWVGFTIFLKLVEWIGYWNTAIVFIFVNAVLLIVFTPKKKKRRGR